MMRGQKDDLEHYAALKGRVALRPMLKGFPDDDGTEGQWWSSGTSCFMLTALKGFPDDEGTEGSISNESGQALRE
jgi:hypothetical protein